LKKSNLRRQISNEHHPDHSEELNRINRIIGQLTGVRSMIENQRYCPEILIQTQAVRSAIKSLEGAILAGHLEHCVKDAMQSASSKEANKKIEELIELFKRSS